MTGTKGNLRNCGKKSGRKYTLVNKSMDIGKAAGKLVREEAREAEKAIRTLAML